MEERQNSDLENANGSQWSCATIFIAFGLTMNKLRDCRRPHDEVLTKPQKPKRN